MTDPFVFPVVKIEAKGRDLLRVELHAASLMIFEVRYTDATYDKLLADLCRVIPAMLRYDVDLAEAYDDAFRTKPKVGDVLAVQMFTAKYRGQISAVSDPLPEFEQFLNT